jgi:hypothetical protein
LRTARHTTTGTSSLMTFPSATTLFTACSLASRLTTLICCLVSLLNQIGRFAIDNANHWLIFLVMRQTDDCGAIRTDRGLSSSPPFIGDKTWGGTGAARPQYAHRSGNPSVAGRGRKTGPSRVSSTFTNCSPQCWRTRLTSADRLRELTRRACTPGFRVINQCCMEMQPC